MALQGARSGTSLKGLAAATLLLASGLAFAPPSSAAGLEWRIDSPQSIVDEPAWLVNGSIVVAQGGVLTVRNSTLLFVLAFDGELKLEVLQGGSLIIENSTLTAQGGSHYWNFLVSGHLEARAADISNLRGDAGLGGIEATGSDILIEDSSIHHNRYYGIQFHSGAATVRNTTFDANVVGLFVTPGASPRLEGVTVRNSTGFGLKVNDASPVVRNLTVLGSTPFAVGAVAGVLDIVGCKISGAEVGIDAVQGTTGGVDQCEFLTVGTGVRARGSPVHVSESTFFAAGLGVNASSSAVVVEANTFVDVAVGVRATGDSSVLDPGQGLSNDFSGSGVGFELFVPNFFLQGNTYTAQMTGSRIFHTMTLQVVDAAGAAAVRATLKLTAADGTAVFSGLTNETGQVDVTLEEYRELANGSHFNMTPYALRIETPGQVTETVLNATSDRTERITLAAAPPAQVLGFSREAILFGALLFGAAAAVGALGMRARLRKAASKVEERKGRSGRRRGPRSGR